MVCGDRSEQCSEATRPYATAIYSLFDTGHTCSGAETLNEIYRDHAGPHVSALTP